MKLLRIAQIAPIVERVPPKKYGGTERIVWALTEELVKKGHKVTLFATGDSITQARLSYIFPVGLREAKIPNKTFNEWREQHLKSAYKRQAEFDIIHDHNEIPIKIKNTTPVVLTHHGLLSKFERPLNKHVYEVAISNSQKSEIKGSNISRVVYHGLPLEDYPFLEKPMKYLLFVGRITKVKGLLDAVKVAKTLHLKLIIAAKVDKKDEEYFKKYVRQKLNDPHIDWIGEVSDEERNRLMANALALLHPAKWMEPFGLTMIEAMACGAPVIGYNKGSVPEIVENGKSGFVVENVNQMIEAVKNINRISRNYCRNYALEKFNSRRMAENYENLYYEILRREEISLPGRESLFDPLIRRVD